MRTANDGRFLQFTQLAAGDGSPRAAGIQLKIQLPVAYGFQGLADGLVKKRDIVMRIRVAWMNLQCGQVVGQCLVSIASLIEKIAQVEMRQRIFGRSEEHTSELQS